MKGGKQCFQGCLYKSHTCFNVLLTSSLFASFRVFSDCSLPLLFQCFWDSLVVPDPFHAHPHPPVQGFGEHNSQVQVVCYFLPFRRLPCDSCWCLWSVGGRLGVPRGCRCSYPGSLFRCDHHQLSSKEAAREAAREAAKLGLPSLVDAVLGPVG